MFILRRRKGWARGGNMKSGFTEIDSGRGVGKGKHGERRTDGMLVQQNWSINF